MPTPTPDLITLPTLIPELNAHYTNGQNLFPPFPTATPHIKHKRSASELTTPKP